MNNSPAIYEFLLWNNCNNNCKFCHQKANKNKYPNKFLNDDGKLKSIQIVKKYIKENNIESGSHVLFMGGELFDTKLSNNVELEFFDLLNIVIKKMLTNEIDLLYINTNLIYKDMSLLLKFLNSLYQNKLENRIRFTTSYDIDYRYKSINDKKLVENNMIYINKKYSHMFKTANCIMTDKACEYLLKNPKFIYEFKNIYGFNLNLIPYIILKDQYAPSRKTILSLLLKINELIPNYLENYVNNLMIKQERILWEFNGEKLIYASSKNSLCGHNENFKKVYLNDERCFICDCINLKNNI